MNSNSQVSEGMGDRGPYQVLGVPEDASFEEIQTARDRQMALLNREAEQQEVEQAYDAILMQRLRLRKEGKIPVPDRIRYPDREREPSPPKIKTSKKEPVRESWLNGWIDTPSTQDIWIPFGIMAAIGASTTIYRGDQFPSWALAFAVLTSLYFLYSKEKRFWRSLGLSVAGLALGLFFASAVISGLASGSAPVSLTIMLSLLIMWLFTAFLR